MVLWQYVATSCEEEEPFEQVARRVNENTRPLYSIDMTQTMAASHWAYSLVPLVARVPTIEGYNILLVAWHTKHPAIRQVEPCTRTGPAEQEDQVRGATIR